MTDWYHHLNEHEITVYSQTGEEGIIEEIFRRLGNRNNFLVDLGAGDGYTLSNTQYFIDRGWRGARFDLNTHDQPDLHQAVITAENIVDLLTAHQVPRDFDLLSIDIDGTDWYVLRALLLGFHPRLLVCEINPGFPAEPAQAIVYNPNHRFDDCNYFGATLGAYHRLARHHGYQLLHVQESLNAFFIDAAMLPATFTPTLDFPINQYWPPDPQQRPWHLITDADVSAGPG